MQCTSNYPFYNKMDILSKKRGTHDHGVGEEEASVGCNRRRGHKSGRGCGM